MPFDGTPPIRLGPLDPDLLRFGPSPSPTIPTDPRALPAWHVSRRAESRANAVAVLARARQLIADERRWCRGSFARGWYRVPVPVGSGAARSYCALGAIMRAGRDLSIRTEDACVVLEWQINRPIQDWNDDPVQTHAEVIAAFDAALLALAGTA